MNTNPALIRGLSFLCLLTTPSLALQNQHGIGTSLASGLSLEVTSGAEVMYVNPPGNATPIAPAAAQPVGVPDYRMSKIFQGYDHLVEIDAHSTGNGVIPRPTATTTSDNVWSPDLNSTMNWMEIVVSFDRETPSSQQPPLLQPRATAGSDLIGFAPSNNVGYPGSLLGQAMMEQGAPGMGLTANDDLDALDFAIGVQLTSGGGEIRELFQRMEYYFFSLTPASCSLLNGTTNVTPFQGITADPAAIYRLEWDGMDWVSLMEYRTAADLVGQLSGTNVDAIEVDPNQGTIVYSLDTTPAGFSQLMLYDDLASGSQKFKILGDGGQSPGGTAMEVLAGDYDDTSNADAICIIEPHVGGFMTHVVTPIRVVDTSAFGGTGQFGQSMTRSRAQVLDSGTGNLVDVDRVHFELSGWGQGPPMAGTVLVIARVHQDTWADDLTGWETLAIVPRGSLDEVIGATFDYAPGLWEIPMQWSAVFLDSQGAVQGSTPIGVLLM